MQLKLNRIQRGVLIVAGILLILSSDAGWLATFQFMVAVGFFVLAASTKVDANAKHGKGSHGKEASDGGTETLED